MRSANGSGASTSCSRGASARSGQNVISSAASSVGSLSRVQSRLGVANLVLIACVAIAVWLVFVPVAALIYNAFTEDTGFGPGAFSFENFAEAEDDNRVSSMRKLECSPRWLGHCDTESV